MLATRASFLLLLCAAFQLQATTPAVRILESMPYEKVPSIIDQHEWKELQLERVITQLDRTQTSFGRWGLTHLLHPIADKDEILRRQKIVAFLVEHPDVLSHFQKQLAQIKKYEKSLLAYWDKKDQLNSNCEHFYYTLPGFKDYLNKNSIALNVGVAMQMFDAGKNLLISLCLKGVSDELLHWAMAPESDKSSFNFRNGVNRGIAEPIKQHSWKLDLLKGRENDNYFFKDYARVGMAGSWGDRFTLFSQGVTGNFTELGLPFDVSLTTDKNPHIFAKAWGALWASIPTLAYDYFWGISLLAIARNITFMYSSMKGLIQRVSDVTLCCDAVARMVARSQKYTDVFGSYVTFDQKNHGKGIGFMVTIAQKCQDHKTLYKYSGGHILALHKNIQQEKSSLIPVLQMVGLLDAYCSIAQLVKESETQENRFSFVTFVDAPQPYLAYENTWLPLLAQEKAVVNDVCLGGKCAGKIIITGPNGGGKSTILKTVGVAAVLAQGWGIVPALSAEQTIFEGIKTGIAPHEDLQQGLSTFMAEKKCMERLDALIKKTHKNNKVLVLVDEPYKGTVDAESAKRIYTFGMDAALYPYTLLCIATHVKQPIFLAADTKGVFANYQVEIREKSYGQFERLFTLKQGPATWWFENEDQRGRFVDWISVLLESQQEKNKTYDTLLLGKSNKKR